MSDIDKALLDALVEAAVDAIIVTDCNGLIIRANRSASRLFGHDPQTMLGRPVEILMPDDIANRHSGFMTRYMTTGEQRIIGKGRELTARRADGSEIPIHLSVGRADIGDAVAFIGIVHDLSLRRMTEAALEHAQRMEAIGRLTGGIAHDFNNLLTVILGNIELMEDRLEDPKLRELAMDALEAAEIGTALIGQLMAFARKSTLQPALVDANEALRRIGRLLERTLDPGLSLRLELSDEVRPIRVDPLQLDTAILNLAINAQDATKSGELVLETSTARIDDPFLAAEMELEQGEYTRITVSDTGVGMGQPEVERAFEPYFTTKSAGRGTGLGLAMVYGFARQSGGHVTLYSRKGLGTVASLYLPLASETCERDDPLPGSPITARKGSGERILVVEDDPDVRANACRRIEALGYRATPAPDATRALAILEECQGAFGAVFSDLALGSGPSGAELAARTHDRWPKLPVILTSGYASDQSDPGSTTGPRRVYIQKPYRQSDLAVALAQVVNSSTSAGS